MNTGSCLCGTVRWQMEGPYKRMSHCHCSMCRKAHAAPFATYLTVAPERFEMLSGADAITEYESSPGFPRHFCSHCGSVVPTPRPSTDIAVPAGCLDDDPGIRPERHIFAASKPAWDVIADDLPQFDDYGRASAPPTIDRPNRAKHQPGILRGSCLCGGVAYEATTPLLAVHNCHCTRCRKARAAAHTTNGFVATENLRFLRGDELLTRYKVPEAQFFTQAFCKTCGSGMPNRDPARPRVAIPFGTLDDDPGRGAEDHIFCAFKAPWYDIADDLPQHDKRP
ncbi:MAG: hypothetical protein GKS00_07885 [Alphaproteobacteria bacterium]|nr:hypothetical protein [Alphaproteobacteria bacterium]